MVSNDFRYLDRPELQTAWACSLLIRGSTLLVIHTHSLVLAIWWVTWWTGSLNIATLIDCHKACRCRRPPY